MIPLLTWEWPETPIVLAVIVAVAIVLRWVIVRAIKAGVDRSLQGARERNASFGSRAERVLAAATGMNWARHEARTRTIGSVLRRSSLMAEGCGGGGRMARGRHPLLQRLPDDPARPLHPG